MARVAVVEDNKHVRRFMETLLKLRGHDVTSFENGEDGFQAISAGAFELVISDVQMPKRDGISLCSELRKTFSKEQLPVLLVSVLDAEEDILRALEAGANDYLVKPCSSAMVSAKVAYHLKRAASAEAAPASMPKAQLNEFKPGTPPQFPCAFDKYVLHRNRGSGAYGVVYEATRKKDGYKLALKVLDRRVNADREMLARYFREVAALAAINNPHVVSFIDSGFYDGVYYLGMELVDGDTIWDRVHRGAGAFNVPQTLALCQGVCSALDAIHKRELVHRDVKSANILFTPEGKFVLIDFGLAKGENEHGLTNPDEFLGTAEFISPEVITGDMQHIGSDLYALGVTMFEALTRQLPFTGDTAYEILRRIASRKPAPAVRVLRKDVPQPVSDLIQWLLHPDREARAQSPADVLRELEPLIRRYGSPPSDEPPTAPSRRRHGATRRVPPPKPRRP